MTSELRKVFSLLIIVQWTGVYCVEDEDQNISHESLAFRPYSFLGESCLELSCYKKKNLCCNEKYICQCESGFKTYQNECIPIAGENEFCITHEDCCGNLICINGLCRKPGTGNEFVTLAKICLGITVTTIIIAVFSSLMKCLIRYDSSRAFRRASARFESSVPFERHMSSPDSALCEIREEKPPSYDECMRSGLGNPLVSPPPYIISTNSVTNNVETSPVLQSTNIIPMNPQNVTTPLNVQNLNNGSNTNVIVTQDPEKAPNNIV